MEQDIKMFEEFIERDFSNPMGWSGYYDSELKELQQALKHLIKAYKELEEENKTLNERNQYLVKYRAKLEKELYESNENYIPVSLVEEKIEELIKEGRHYNANKIEVLQELLEKRK